MKRLALTLVWLLIMTLTTPLHAQPESPLPITALDGTPMIAIPGGPFTAGFPLDAYVALCQSLGTEANAPSLCDADQMREFILPPQPVTVDAYWIDQYEVSRLDYLRCVVAGVCTSDGIDRAFAEQPLAPLSVPMQYVSPSAAQTYCEWRDARLPTEIEWAYAARGPEALIYPQGNTFDGNRINFCDANCEQAHANTAFDDGFPLLAPVMSLPTGQSWSGVHHMSGNIAEWSLPSPELRSVTDDLIAIARGGAWVDYPIIVLPAMSSPVTADEGLVFVGFRCARNPDTQ